MYKVTYTKVALMGDGSSQGKETVYTNLHLSRVQTEIDKLLLEDEQTVIIDEIKNIDGYVLSDLNCDAVK